MVWSYSSPLQNIKTSPPSGSVATSPESGSALNLSYLHNRTPSKQAATAQQDVILVVDDSPEILSVFGSLLKNAGYHVKVANCGQTALTLAARAPQPSLILLDVMMPQMNGYDVLRQLQSSVLTRDIPVVFLTAQDAVEDEERAFDAGIADYIVKPIKPAVVLARVRSQLLAHQAKLWLKDENLALEAEVTRRMRENELIQAVSIRALAHIAETRDNETGAHLERTQAYVHLLAMRLSTHPRFKAQLDPHFIKMLTLSAPLHDIGKVGIPDSILLKAGPLEPDEWAVMKTHTLLGSDAISLAERDLETSVDFFTQAKEIARWHHEKWNGSGYPDGLSGNDIPLSARLMALADVFDALISKRVYKPALSFSEVRRLMAEQKGVHFDPDAAEVFLQGYEEFEAIAVHYGIER